MQGLHEESTLQSHGNSGLLAYVGVERRERCNCDPLRVSNTEFRTKHDDSEMTIMAVQRDRGGRLTDGRGCWKGVLYGALGWAMCIGRRQWVV